MSFGVGNLTTAASGYGGQANTGYGLAVPGIRNQLNPNPQTYAALTQLPMQAATAAFGGAQDAANRRVAATRNPAGASGLADQLARSKAQAVSSAGLRGQQAVQGLQNTGVQNAMGLYGIGARTQQGLLNTAAQYSEATRPKFNFGIGPNGPSFGASNL